ncbi:MAG: hypothetical protein KDK70_24595 [Myxococcales bacterium]|nr:hypothetical protein [Myxococcales bacterium]
MFGSRLTIAWGLSALLLAGCQGASGDGDGDDGPASTDDGPVNLDCEGANSVLAGHAVIESEADLAALDGVRAIEGELQIDKTSFTDLDALGCIEEVGSHLTIFGNTALTDVSGLSSLQRVGGDFIFSDNTALVDFDGAPALTEVGNSLIIHDDDAMTGISGLGSLATIGAAINIRSNDALLHIDGLRGLRSVGGQLAITQNPNLCISSVNQVGAGITDPATIPDNWSTRSNDDDC